MRFLNNTIKLCSHTKARPHNSLETNGESVTFPSDVYFTYTSAALWNFMWFKEYCVPNDLDSHLTYDYSKWTKWFRL